MLLVLCITAAAAAAASIAVLHEHLAQFNT
jgi:hypothetical protein